MQTPQLRQLRIPVGLYFLLETTMDRKLLWQNHIQMSKVNEIVQNYSLAVWVDDQLIIHWLTDLWLIEMYLLFLIT
jgi:hypothetical protein